MVSPTKKYREQGQYGTEPEPQTKPAQQGTPSGAPPPPGGMTPEQAAIEARVRLKMARGTPLDAEERRFLASLPADSEVPPDAFAQRARKPTPRAQRGAHEQLDPSDPRHLEPFEGNVAPTDRTPTKPPGEREGTREQR